MTGSWNSCDSSSVRPVAAASGAQQADGFQLRRWLPNLLSSLHRGSDVIFVLQCSALMRKKSVFECFHVHAKWNHIVTV